MYIHMNPSGRVGSLHSKVSKEYNSSTGTLSITGLTQYFKDSTTGAWGDGTITVNVYCLQ